MTRGDAAPRRLGVGLGYRPEIARPILEHAGEIDFVEVLADRVLTGDAEAWEKLKLLSTIFPVVPHGVNLSIGSVDCLDDAPYMRALKRLSRFIKFPYYSDHLAMTKVGGRDLGHLSPLWATREQLDVVVDNVLAIQEVIKKPLVLENITLGFEIPGGDMTQAELLNAVVERTGCGILLDVANIFVNSKNFRLDAERFIDTYSLRAVRQIHLAGGVRMGDVWYDSHSSSIAEPVWELFAYVAPRCPNLVAVLIERDSGFDDFDGLLAEVRRARSLWLGEPKEKRG